MPTGFRRVGSARHIGDHEAQAATGFGRKLQPAAFGEIRRPAGLGDHHRSGAGSQRLLRRPQDVARPGAGNDDQPAGIEEARKPLRTQNRAGRTGDPQDRTICRPA